MSSTTVQKELATLEKMTTGDLQAKYRTERPSGSHSGPRGAR